MSAEVDFTHTKIGYSGTEELACLGTVSGCLMAILVRSSEHSSIENQQWYLDTGFGPCDRQGLMFSSLDAAKKWIQLKIDEMINS